MTEQVLWYCDLGKCGSVPMEVWNRNIDELIARGGTIMKDERNERLLLNRVFWVEAYGLIAPTLHGFIACFDDQNFVAEKGERLDYFTTKKWGLGWRENVLVREGLADRGKPLKVKMEKWADYLTGKYPEDERESTRILTTKVARVIAGPAAMLPMDLKLGETVYIALSKGGK